MCGNNELACRLGVSVAALGDTVLDRTAFNHVELTLAYATNPMYADVFHLNRRSFLISKKIGGTVTSKDSLKLKNVDGFVAMESKASGPPW